MGKPTTLAFCVLAFAVQSSVVLAQTPAPQPPASQPPASQPPARQQLPHGQTPTQVYVHPQPQPAPTEQVYSQPQPVAPCPPTEHRPSTIPYRPGPPPKGYVLEDDATTGLWVTGAAILGGAYVISVFAARPTQNDGTDALYAPVFGPWITMGQCTSCDDTAYSALLLDGLAQLAGTTMIVLGIVVRDRKFVRTYDELSVSVTPRRFGDGGYGVGLFGRF